MRWSNKHARDAALVWLLLGACATAPANDGEPRRKVAEVLLEGSKALSESDVASGLANHPPEGWFFKDWAELDQLSLELDRQRILSYYRARGYFSAEVIDVQIEPPEGTGDVTIRWQVEEGPQSRLIGLKLEGAPTGAPEVSEERLLEIAALPVGEPLEYGEYESSKERIQAWLHRRGYANARVEGRVAVNREAQSIVVHFIVMPGPVVHFGEVQIQVEPPLLESSVRNRIAWAEGDVYDPTLVDLTEGRLYDLPLVGSVQLDRIGEPESDRLDMVIRLSASTPNEIRLGGGVARSSGNFEVRARVSYSRRNFFDPLTTFRIETRPALSFVNTDTAFAGFSVEARAEVLREDVFLPRLRAGVSAAYTVTRQQAYTVLGPSGRLTLNRSFLLDRLQAGLSWTIEHFDLSAVSDAIPEADRPGLGIFDPIPVTYFEPALQYDGRDDPLNPKFGIYLRMRFEAGYAFPEIPTTYLKVTPEARGYLPLGTDRIVLAGRVRMGETLLNSQPLPITRRFYSGGAENQRGFGRNRLGPGYLGSDGKYIPVGGEAVVEANLELRVDVFKLFGQWIGVVAFMDGADVGSDLGVLDLTKLHFAAGGGLRYHTPVGPIRVDFGVRLNRRGVGEPDPGSDTAFHFSLGEAF